MLAAPWPCPPGGNASVNRTSMTADLGLVQQGVSLWKVVRRSKTAWSESRQPKCASPSVDLLVRGSRARSPDQDFEAEGAPGNLRRAIAVPRSHAQDRPATRAGPLAFSSVTLGVVPDAVGPSPSARIAHLLPRCVRPAELTTRMGAPSSAPKRAL